MIRLLSLLLALALAATAARGDTALVAVASNFLRLGEKLAAEYAAASGHQVTLTAGATGKLYAQIVSGAPYDALLAADSATPARLIAEGFAPADSRFTYAVGHLALWSADPAADLSDPAAALRTARHVAIANPDLSPYGRAAAETLDTLDLAGALSGRLVTAENIGQAQALVASGAAEVGFVAVAGLGEASGGATWLVPEAAHRPIIQDAVLLRHGAENPAARGFLAFLASPEATAKIEAAGYTVRP